jgi:hypothetical protein
VEDFVDLKLQKNDLQINGKYFKRFLTAEKYQFLEGDFEALKRSPSFSNGFDFMNKDYIILDYLKIDR